jgi:hypothetical protein
LSGTTRSDACLAHAELERVADGSDVGPEVADVKKSVDAQGIGGLAGLLQPSLRMPMIVGLGLAVFQQITGINTVIYYAPTAFKFAGIAATGSAILGRTAPSSACGRADCAEVHALRPQARDARSARAGLSTSMALLYHDRMPRPRHADCSRNRP